MRVVIFDNDDYNALFERNCDNSNIKDDAYCEYINKYGMHFNKKLVDYAISNMIQHNPSTGEVTETFIPIAKQELDALLVNYGIAINNNKLYDYLYVANMCKADFINSSIIDDRHLCLYVKDVIDDADGYDGLPFARWLADIKQKGIIIDWQSMLN